MCVSNLKTVLFKGNYMNIAIKLKQTSKNGRIKGIVVG